MSEKKIADCLEQMMKTTPYSKITVQMICKEVPISRNAFYYHFKNKQEVLEWKCCDYFVRNALPYHKLEQGLIGCRMLVNYIYEKKDFYRAIYDVDNGILLHTCLMKAHLIAMEEEHARSYGHIVPTEKKRVLMDVYKNYAVSGVVGVLTWWIGECFETSPEEIAFSLHTMFSEKLGYVRDHLVY